MFLQQGGLYDEFSLDCFDTVATRGTTKWPLMIPLNKRRGAIKPKHFPLYHILLSYNGHADAESSFYEACN